MTIDLGGAKKVSLNVKQNLMGLFLQLLGQGIYLEVQAGCSLKDLLCSQLGIPSEYLSDRIQTIFLDSKPVDDTATAIAGPGATIALSAAMPGLVGAVMRKGGHYAALRQVISHGSSAECPAAAKGSIRLKLFNLVAAELGPSLLSRGVGIRGKDFHDFISRQVETLIAGCVGLTVGGEAVELKEALKMNWGDSPVFLTVVTETQ